MEIFGSLDLRNPLTDFHETWNIELPPGDLPQCKVNFQSDDVGGLGSKYSVCKICLFVFLVSSSRPQVAPLDLDASPTAFVGGVFYAKDTVIVF